MTYPHVTSTPVTRPNVTQRTSSHTASDRDYGNINGEGNAVCLFGQMRGARFSIPTIEKHIFQTLNPDIFISTTTLGDYPYLQNVTEKWRNRSWTRATDLSRVLEQATRGPNLTRGQKTESLVVVDALNASSFDIEEWFKRKKGFSDLQKVLQGRLLHGPTNRKMYFHIRNCGRLINKAEVSRGYPYAHIALVRPDHYLLTSYPNPNLLQRKKECYLSFVWNDGEGLADFGSLCSRDAAQVIMGGIERLISQPLPQTLHHLSQIGLRKEKNKWVVNSEIYTKMLFRIWGNITLWRIPDIGFLTCSPNLAHVVSGEDPQCHRAEYTLKRDCVEDEELKGVCRRGFMKPNRQMAMSLSSWVERCGWSRHLMIRHSPEVGKDEIRSMMRAVLRNSTVSSSENLCSFARA
ncbi:hypothetical protein AAMO2058_001389800 [Amorphochlora amoebiformis]